MSEEGRNFCRVFQRTTKMMAASISYVTSKGSKVSIAAAFACRLLILHIPPTIRLSNELHQQETF